ncbi:biotin--protein ligase isoform X2 [Anthonomus grandis grandis]|nr:biotin--protein ligase isoform X2 [Anthonomus grandis grandis]
MDKLTKLIHCFSQRDCDINHELQLLKIETIDIDGVAKRIVYERQYSIESSQKYSLAPVHWKKFVKDVKDLYSKIRDATNPKITIDNGTPKPEEVKIVPVSEVKPIKKDKKATEEKNTLDVNCSDYRRHRSTEHKHRKHRSKDEAESPRSQKLTDKDKDERTETSVVVEDEVEGLIIEEKDMQPEAGPSRQHIEEVEFKHEENKEIKEKKQKDHREHKEHRHKEKHKHKKAESKDRESKGERSKEKASTEEHQPSDSGAQKKSAEKIKKEGRTSSKEKKLVRASATCDEPTDTNKVQGTTQIQNGSVSQKVNPEKFTETVPETASLNDPNIEVESPADSDDFTGDRKMLQNAKPLNVLVYSESSLARTNVKEALETILNKLRYTIYDLPKGGSLAWRETAALVVVCGNVDPKLTYHLMKYLLNGGQLLCLCSDLLYSVLHNFTTAEVREHELVRFTYGKWRNVKMMHHVFCYQASPAKKQFSKDSDASNQSSGNGSSPIAPKTPSTVEIQHGGKDYTIQVQILGAEETWQTPSLLLASVKGTEGKAVFSQIHLEIDPVEYEEDENYYKALTGSNQDRLDILKDLLVNQLGLDCNNIEDPVLTPAYFLGCHELKLAMMSESHSIKEDEMTVGDMHVLFCGKDDPYDEPTTKFLPILVHACPQNFNTVSYFDTLNTKYIGRLVIYSDVMATTHQLVKHSQLSHGIAVITRQQLAGVGRSKNRWLSPAGSALFSLQLHISTITNLGKSQGLIQHLIMVAVVKAVKHLTGNHTDIHLGIKWPNDLYANGIKIGGAMVTSTILGELASINIGCGVNLSNSLPTTCINDIIKNVNQQKNSGIPEISHEMFFAQVFNETEKLIDRMQVGNFDYFYDYYYEYWLHNDAVVTVTKQGKLQQAKVVGISDQGYLKVKSANGEIEVVHPDGNTFDMLKGLIYPKDF